MANTVYHIDAEGLAHYHGTKVEPRLTALEGYFDESGNAKNALTLGGHDSSYYATADAVAALKSGTTWQAPVANIAALKAVTAPVDTETRCVEEGSNAVYQFDAQNTATADDAENGIYVADDGTAGAWIKLSHLVYQNATQTADGLMSAADKKKLDGLSADIDAKLETKVDKEDGKGLSTNDYTTAEKEKLAALPTNADLETALAGKVDKVDGKGLSTNDYDDASKTKLDGLAEIKTIGTNLELAADGTLSGTYTYTPTVATKTAAGVVKVGDNIDVAEDGTISVTFPDIQTATNDMIDAAFNA